MRLELPPPMVVCGLEARIRLAQPPEMTESLAAVTFPLPPPITAAGPWLVLEKPPDTVA
jgi:hypothetical protein